MSPTPRRSSRLRGSSATPTTSHKHSSNRLSSLAERDETPTYGAQSNLDLIVSSPIHPTTPTAGGRIKPAREEMHPSKAHQSTTHEPDSGLRLGFTDINAKGSNQPSGVAQYTPSKTDLNSIPFDFRFSRHPMELGPEALQMMNGLREDALRIKVKLAAEQEEQKRKAGDEAACGIRNRKIAEPKGKVGRFSDIHMAEFKKMDSIAGHASSFRAQPGRFAPITTSLKRSQSKARLDDGENTHTDIGYTVEKPSGIDRAENPIVAKRARQMIADDTSSSRPGSRDNSHSLKKVPCTPILSRSQSSMLASVTTPTQASLARAANVPKPGTQTTSSATSRSKATPRGLTKSATINSLSSIARSDSKSFLRSPGKLDRVKSILGYPGSSTKKAPTMSSSIPSPTRNTSKPNIDKALPSVPTTTGDFEPSKSSKHVNFAPHAIDKRAAAVRHHLTPMKSYIPRSTSKIGHGTQPYANHPSGSRLQAKEVHYPSVAGHLYLSERYQEVNYPCIDALRTLPDPIRQVNSLSQFPPSVPGTFHFRSDHTISFGASPKGFGSSPGQASVRQVRQSIFPNPMPGSFPYTEKENVETVPSVQHETFNKKRRRADAEDEEEEDIERAPKKHKLNVDEGASLLGPGHQAEMVAPKSKIPSPGKKRGVLSLSRLNMLARPKMRR